MSMDLYVITSGELDVSLLREFVSGRKSLSIETGSDGDCSWISLSGNGEVVPAISVWGPDEVEAEDVEEMVLEIVSAPKTSLQLSVSAGAPAQATKLAQELSCFIARRTGGVAFDPQEGKILYPRPGLFSWLKPARSRTKPATETATQAVSNRERADTLTLEFLLPFPSVPCTSAEKLLQILREHCAAAVPTRFGPTEPFKYKLPKNDASFSSVWGDQSAAPHSGAIFWNSSAPGKGGMIFFADRFAEIVNKPTDLPRRHRLAISFDAAAIEQDKTMVDQIVKTFHVLARELNAFYAAAFFESDCASISPGLNYRGLPELPTWLAWFGPAYSEILRPAFDGSETVVEDSNAGIFLRMADFPLKARQLNSFPQLPQSLKCHGGDGIASTIPYLDDSAPRF